ncbi:hypothetical protein M3Y94_00413300 [Aphelenchoides besseyi]|nr:hypothetical protein M3Y94_00413300 [Aphelenchoides besseyi]
MSRRSTAGNHPKRFSPYPQRLRNRPESSTKPTIEFDDNDVEDDIENDPDYDVAVDVEHEQHPLNREYQENPDAFVIEDAVSLRQIGSFIESQDFLSNAEIVNEIPNLTRYIQAVDVLELYRVDLTAENVAQTFAGCAAMINRLMFENRHLARELQALKMSGSGSGMSPFDALVFKKSNVRDKYYFHEEDGIPSCELKKLMDVFDQNCTRRNELAINTLRRFVKYMLENIIPKPLHNKFTVRERGGYERLIELPTALTNALKAICLESVNLLDARTADDKDRQSELSEKLITFMKFALQELRRTPRKSKVPVSRD